MPEQAFIKPQTFPVDLPVYQGPLDLLLQLIERQELDITKVALAQVTDQYLAHVRAMPAHDLQDIADFLIIAARLILIKSEALLPRPPGHAPGEDDPGEALARQLILYKKYKELSEMLRHREEEGLRTYLRTAAPPKADPRLDISNLTPDDLWRHFTRALSLMPETPSVAEVVVPPQITIRDQIRRIQVGLRTGGRVRFFEMLREAQSRVEVLITFLAILELVKQRRVMAYQERLFGDIVIEPLGDWVNDDSLQIYSEMEPPEAEDGSATSGAPAPA